MAAPALLYLYLYKKSAYVGEREKIEIPPAKEEPICR
jgi:hypothetical protein